uniref:Uncharacterized protein n=1 Tax=Wuchereria bancrofti TaxID=6293 RepID=A0AAF5Q5Y0_WUCBA
MEINRLILFLYLYQTFRCTHVAIGNINGNEEAMSGRKLKNYKCNEQNKDNQDVNSIDPLKYMDSLFQNTINNFSAIIDVIRQQYIANLRDKYVRFKNTFDKAQTMKDNGNSTTSFHGHQYDKRTVIPCAGENCFTQNILQERTFNRTVTLLRHTALRRAFLNTTNKFIERKYNNAEIPVNVERQAKDFYVSSVIPLKVLNEKSVGERTSKSTSDVKHQIIITEKNVTRSYETKREKLEDSTESIIVAIEVSTVTSLQLPEISMGTVWWNSIWFWIIDLIALILLLILILSCCIWHCGSSSSSSSSNSSSNSSSSKRSNYIRI